MYIHDVIGSLREKHLDLQNQINALRLTMAIIEDRLSRSEGQQALVSRETKEIPEGDGNGSQTHQAPKRRKAS